MLTDCSSSFKIINANTQQLICSHSSSNQKIIYRQFPSVPQNSLDKIQKLANISHPHLLPIHKIEKHQRKVQSHFQHNTNESTQVVGLQVQFYTGSLEKYLGNRNNDFDQEEILNTFQPVEEIIHFMMGMGWKFTGVGLHNIVITEEMEIKYIDDCVLFPNNEQKPEKTCEEIYQQICQLIFQILISQKNKSRTWKTRLRMVRQKCSKQLYEFFVSIYNKSLVNICDKSKTKKIWKKNCQRVSKKCGESEQSSQKAIYHILEGKQNKIQVKN